MNIVYNGQTDFLNHIIYICKASSLLENTIVAKDIGLFLINDCEFDCSSFSFDCVEFSYNTDIFKIYNDVQNIFNAHRKIEVSFGSLLQSLITGEGLKYIVQISSEILENPVLVTDVAHQLLGYSSNYQVNDPTWQDIIEVGYSSNGNIIRFREENIIKK